MNSKTGKVVNKKELAQLFGVSVQSVDGWLGRGCPVLEKTKGSVAAYRFSVQDVVAWKIQREVARALEGRPSGAEQDDFKRKLAAEASLAELKFAREAGLLVTIEDVEAEWAPRISNCRAKLLAVPAKVAVFAHASETAEEVQSLIETAIHEALNELADGGDSEEDRESSDGDPGITPVDPEDDSDD